ncbi:MAG: Na(+)-translocating NADH-quinone reductase subunit A, partial [Proteiniphilum sp. 51_7]
MITQKKVITWLFITQLMANRIKIKKGLRIPLLGECEETLRGTVSSEVVRICPEDFQGITPKLAVKAGDSVKAG